jgi:hypothetical protein
MKPVVYEAPEGWSADVIHDLTDPDKADSLWHGGHNPVITVKTPTNECGYVGVYGEVRLLLDDKLVTIEDLERTGINTDQKLYELVEQDKLVIDMNNWYECRSIYEEEFEDCVHHNPIEAYDHLLEIMDRDYAIELEQEQELWEN